MSKVRFATSNMFKKLDADQSRRHVDKVIAQADIVVWQEATWLHRRTLRRTPGWATYFPRTPGGLAISWRTDRFKVRRAGRAIGVVPGSRFFRDPIRGFADIVLQDLADGTLWPVLGTHMTHQSFTSHPERRPRWRAQSVRLWLRSRRLARRWGRVLGGGDVNRHHWAPRGTIGEWPPGGTHGQSKYDVLWRRGRVALVRGAHEIRTPSDHDTAVATFRST